MTLLERWLPFLRWPRPGAALLRNEAIAALTVAVVMVPQSVAYAALAGMPLVAGLYATFLPMLVAVMFGSSTRLSVGPSALSALLVGASLLGMAQPESQGWIGLAVWLAFLAGAMQLVVGATGAAWLLNLVSSPVLAGFSQAAALLIMASQLPALLGFEGSLRDLFDGSVRMNAEALAYGLGSLALMMLGRRYAPRLPAMLLVLAAAGALSAATGFESRAKVIGVLPAGLPSFYWPSWPGWERFSDLIAPALVIALVSSLEMASSAKIESQRDGKRWDASQDLIGQGIAKIVSGLCGSFATSTSFSRSAITLYAGAKTAWATVCATVLVLLVLLFLTPVLHPVPQATLAAVVVAAVVNLFKPHTFIALARVDRVEAVTAFVTFAVTIASSPRIYWGVLTGVVMGLAHFLYHRLHPRVIEVGLHPDGSLRDRHLWNLPALAPNLFALRMDSALDFGSASALERDIVEHIAAGGGEVRAVCLFAQPINRIDATGVETFLAIRRMLGERGIVLHISGLKLPVEQVLKRAGALDEGPLLKLYRTEAETVEALQAVHGGAESAPEAGKASGVAARADLRDGPDDGAAAPAPAPAPPITR